MYHRLIFPFVFLVCQSLSGQITLKSYVGGSLSSPKISFLEGTDEALKMRLESAHGSIASPYIGMQLQKRFDQHFSFNIAFQYCIKGQSLLALRGFQYKAAYLDIIPSIDFNISKNIKLGLGAYFSPKIKNLTINNPFAHGILIRDMDYGLSSSISLEINKFTIRITYLHGLYKTFISTATRYKHRVFQLGIGYSIFES